MAVLLGVARWLAGAVDARIQHKPGGWANDDGLEIAQALALAAAAIFATIAIFAVVQSNAITLVQDLFRTIGGGSG
jgi:hypothetical protein